MGNWFAKQRSAAENPGEGDVAEQLWREHGVVLLPKLDDKYKPLRVLTLSKEDGKPTVRVFSDTILEVFERLSGDSDEPIAVKMLNKEQKLLLTDENSNVTSGMLRTAVKAGLTHLKKTSSGCELVFETRGVYRKDLEKFVNTPRRTPSSGWHSQAYKSHGLVRKNTSTYGVILSVWYAKTFEEKGNSECSTKLDVDVPVGNMLASVGVPAGALVGDMGVSGEGSSTRAHARTSTSTADEYRPIAFEFLLVSWNGQERKWYFDLPRRAPDAKGAKGAQEAWAFEQCPLLKDLGDP